jgi:hypothetical protein
MPRSYSTPRELGRAYPGDVPIQARNVTRQVYSGITQTYSCLLIDNLPGTHMRVELCLIQYQVCIFKDHTYCEPCKKSLDPTIALYHFSYILLCLGVLAQRAPIILSANQRDLAVDTSSDRRQLQVFPWEGRLPC